MFIRQIGSDDMLGEDPHQVSTEFLLLTFASRKM